MNDRLDISEIFLKSKENKINNNEYSKCPKISYTKESDKMAYANSADLIRLLLKKQSDQDPHCFMFH